MSTARLDILVVSVIQGFEKKKMLGGHRHKRFVDTQERTMDTSTKQIFLQVKEFVKRWFWEGIIEENASLDSG